MLLERDSQLAELRSQLDEAKSGQGRIVLLFGEAGIGKTTLLNAFREEVNSTHENKVEFMWGGSDPMFTPRPLGPVHDMLYSFNDRIKELLQNNSELSQLFDALLEFFKHRSKTSVLIFEDAHWADHATLDLLRYLGRRISFLNVMILISFRDDEIDDKHPLNDVIATLPAARTCRIKLDSLSVAGVKQMLLQHGSSEEDKKYHTITGGNPFFITELLASSRGDTGHVPASIRDAVSARINRLGKQEQHFLETVSLIPRAFDIHLLKKLFPDQAETYAMACVGRGLLTLVGAEKFRFRHELARLGTLDRVTTFERRKLHARILEVLLTELNPQVDHIVHHASGALDAKRVLEYAPKAAAMASTSGSHREAASHLSTALKFIDSASTEQAASLYESWALETGLTIGIDDDVIDARRHAISLWRALDNKVKVGENLRWLSRLFWYRGQATEAWRYADEAVKVLEDSPPSAERAMAYSLRSQFHMLHDHMEDAIHWGEKALTLADEYTSEHVKAHALNNIGTAKAFRGNPDGVLDLKESLRISLQNNLHVDAARVYTNLSEYAVKYRDFPLAEKTIAEGIAFDTKHDLDSWTYYLVGRQAELRMLQGRLSEAKIIAKGVLDLDQLTLLMKLPALLVFSRILSLLDEKNARSYLNQALDNAKATNELQHIIPARLSLLEHAWFCDDRDLAIEHLLQLQSIDSERTDIWTLGEIMLWEQRLSGKLHEIDLGLLPLPLQHELKGELSVAAEEWLKLGMPCRAAAALLRVKEGKHFSLLNQALEILEPLGAKALLKMVITRASELGVQHKLSRVKRGPYSHSRKHPLGLTKKEQEVFKLMLVGASNRTIAEDLNRSKRTIEHHVSSILKKMNVESRMDMHLRVQNEPWLVT